MKPIASISTRAEFNKIFSSDTIKKAVELEAMLTSSAADAFTIDGYCIPCETEVSFLVDMEFGGKCKEGIWIPNWRERLECPHCKMNNRQRLISALIKQKLGSLNKKNVYFMEQVTPIYKWASSVFNDHSIVGSEYLGFEYKSGDVIDGIRHENIESLGFEDGELDLIVSNDVFEHVPNPEVAFLECARVLKAGGAMIATIPFHTASDITVTRAKLNHGELVHILPPTYHGNPISAEGSLVFTDFGWDILNMMSGAGFTVAKVDVYSSVRYGHLGGVQTVFRCTK
jgi:SAM-dependent methyltransferase